MQTRVDESGPSPILTPFDVTGLVVGAVVGAGIYVVSSLAAGLMGPAMLVAWAIAGAMATSIALSFAQCAAIIPKSGGSYAYAREAFGYFPGFLVGWMLYMSKLVTLAVFPVAFVGYLKFFLPELNWWQGALAMTCLVAFVTATNCVGTRLTGKVNDALALVKLGPLVILILLGVIFVILNPGTSFSNLVPFAPLGWGGLGAVIILAYWAFAGFELAVLPAAEIVDARRILPVAIIRGMAIVVIFYLLVNVVVAMTIPWHSVAGTSAPLGAAMETTMRGLLLPASAGQVVMVIGALLAILGANESVALCTSRLSLTMAADGYLPHLFARLHPKYGTPYQSLIFQGVFALSVSIAGDLTLLIDISVLSLSVAYLSTVLASMRLVHREPEFRLRFAGSRVVSILALVSTIYLITQSETWILLASPALILTGVVVYACFAPKRELAEVREWLLSEEQRLAAIECGLRDTPSHLLRRIREAFRGANRGQR